MTSQPKPRHTLLLRERFAAEAAAERFAAEAAAFKQLPLSAALHGIHVEDVSAFR